MHPPLSSFSPIGLQQPPLIAFGPGSSGKSVEFLATRRSQRILLLASASCLQADPALAGQLESAFPQTVIRTGIPAEPSVADLEELLKEFASAELDTVIGMGGGSVIDVAKLFSVLHGTDMSVRAFFGSGLVPGRRLGLVALPTTSGAGSEVSPNAILYDEASRGKQAVISPWLLPDAAFVDPRLTLSLSPEMTAASGVDALCHCIEAFTNRQAHPVVDLVAAKGIELIAASLETAVKEGGNLEARTQVSLGSLYGGLCLGSVNTAGVHALSYPLGSALRLPHGLSNAVLLPAVMHFNLEATPERYARVARLMGVSGDGSPVEVAEAGICRLRALMSQCGLPDGIARLGIRSEQIPELAAAAMKVERLLKNNPRPIHQADAEFIYRQAY